MVHNDDLNHACPSDVQVDSGLFLREGFLLKRVQKQHLIQNVAAVG